MAVKNALKPRSRSAAVVWLPRGGSTYPVPGMPKGREWSDIEKDRWVELWESPQASQWDETVTGVVASLIVFEQAIFSDSANAWMAQEARHNSDSLGLTPKAMAALGWKVQEPDE